MNPSTAKKYTLHLQKWDNAIIGETDAARIPPMLAPAPKTPMAIPLLPEGNHSEMVLIPRTNIPDPTRPERSRHVTTSISLLAKPERSVQRDSPKMLSEIALLPPNLSTINPQGICPNV